VRINVERGVYLPVRPSVARGYSSPMRSTRHGRTWQTSARNEDVTAGAGSQLDYPYRSPTTVAVKAATLYWRSWRMPAYSHGTPSTEAAARTGDVQAHRSWCVVTARTCSSSGVGS